jgi:hypothetical protein
VDHRHASAPPAHQASNAHISHSGAITTASSQMPPERQNGGPSRQPREHRPRSAIGVGLSARVLQPQWVVATTDVIANRAYGRVLQ